MRATQDSISYGSSSAQTHGVLLVTLPGIAAAATGDLQVDSVSVSLQCEFGNKNTKKLPKKFRKKFTKMFREFCQFSFLCYNFFRGWPIIFFGLR